MEHIYAIKTICDKIKKSEYLSCQKKVRPLRKDELYGLIETAVTLERFFITDAGWTLLAKEGVTYSNGIIVNLPIIGVHREIASQVGLGMVDFVNKATASLKKGYNPIGPVKVGEDHLYWMVLPDYVTAKDEVNVKKWFW